MESKFLRSAAEAQHLVESIKKLLIEGGIVDISAYRKTIRCNKPQHAALFSFDTTGHIYIARGKRKDDISHCRITGWKYS